MVDFIIAFVMVISLLLYGFRVYDKIDDAFEALKERRSRNG